MGLISTSQLTALRTVAYQGLDTQITIERPEEVETDYGSAPSWTLVATTLAWVREMSTTNVGIMAGALATTGLFRVHVAADTDLRPGDRITVGGQQMTVTDVNDLNTIRIFTTAMCRRVE